MLVIRTARRRRHSGASGSGGCQLDREPGNERNAGSYRSFDPVHSIRCQLASLVLHRKQEKHPALGPAH